MMWYVENNKSLKKMFCLGMGNKIIEAGYARIEATSTTLIQVLNIILWSMTLCTGGIFKMMFAY